MGETRYGWFAVRTECPHCGQPLPLNAPAQNVSCAHCLQDVEVPEGIWKPVLEAFDDQHERLQPGYDNAATLEVRGLRVRYEYGPGAPSCEKCHARYPVDALPVGLAQDFACPQCGDPGSTRGAPEWLQQLVPTARQIYSTDPAGPGAAGAGSLQAEAEARRPIALACPQCGGGLSVTTSSARLVPCSYCNSEVYLPDAVWRRLHPVKTVQRFFVRFEGKSRAQIERAERQARARQQHEHEKAKRAREERRRSAEFEELERQMAEAAAGAAARMVSLKSVAWMATIVASVVLCAFAAWPWIARAGSSIVPVGGAFAEVTVAVGVLALVFVVVAVGLASRPISEAAGNGFEWLLFVTWIWLPAAILVPVVGPLLAIHRSVVLFRGKFGESIIESNGVRSAYPPVSLSDGEGHAAGVLFLVLAIAVPLAEVGMIGLDRIVAFVQLLV